MQRETPLQVLITNGRELDTAWIEMMKTYEII